MGQASAKPTDGASGGGSSGVASAASSTTGTGIQTISSAMDSVAATDSSMDNNDSPSGSSSNTSAASSASGTSAASNASEVPTTETEQEPVEKYCPGGYHPIRIGDVIDDRYHIVRKIGFGHFSTVWLAWDAGSSSVHDPEFRALKVSKSEKVFADATLSEIEILRRISDADPNHAHKDYVCGILDNFAVESVNGKHICMVQHCHGENLLQLIQRGDHKGLPEANVKSVLKQMLQGLHYLHDVCGILHTDIKPENVLVEVSAVRVKKMGMEAVDLHRKGHPLPPHFVGSHEDPDGDIRRTSPVRASRSPWKFPDDVIGSILNTDHSEPDPALTECAITIKIADFGNACPRDRHMADLIQTLPYRSPEVVIEAGYGPPADIWSTACLAFEIATGDYLFDGMVGDRFSTTEDHLGHIVELLGNVPKSLLKKGRHTRKYFNQRGFLKKHHPKRFWPLFDVLVEKYKWDEDRATAFSRLVISMLAYDPDKRVTAETAARDPYLESGSVTGA